VFAIADLPDHASTTAFSLITNAAGTAQVRTTVLMTPEEVDQAVKMGVEYRSTGTAR
jgi:hypothetical protein